MKIRITAREAMDRGVWLYVCHELGINEWAANEGLIDGDEVLELTEAQAWGCGLRIREPRPADPTVSFA